MFRVDWLQIALDELTDLWTQADSIQRRAITAASHLLEQRLRSDPVNEGESRPGGRRITFVPPLAVRFQFEADAHLRDGNEARKLATAACEATSWQDWYSLESLALACAECGDFDAAVKWETKAGELAPDSAKQSNQERLELFRAHKAYHATPPSEVSASPSSK